MNRDRNALQTWIESARTKARDGTLGAADLEVLEAMLGPLLTPLRQRLLYLHAREPSVTAEVIAMIEHDPAAAQSEPVHTRAEWPYASVLDAIRDGWQVIHFPQQLAPFDDRENDIVGFEFILQKMEKGHG